MVFWGLAFHNAYYYSISTHHNTCAKMENPVVSKSQFFVREIQIDGTHERRIVEFVTMEGNNDSKGGKLNTGMTAQDIPGSHNESMVNANINRMWGDSSTNNTTDEEDHNIASAYEGLFPLISYIVACLSYASVIGFRHSVQGTIVKLNSLRTSLSKKTFRATNIITGELVKIDGHEVLCDIMGKKNENKEGNEERKGQGYEKNKEKEIREKERRNMEKGEKNEREGYGDERVTIWNWVGHTKAKATKMIIVFAGLISALHCSIPIFIRLLPIFIHPATEPFWGCGIRDHRIIIIFLLYSFCFVIYVYCELFSVILTFSKMKKVLQRFADVFSLHHTRFSYHRHWFSLQVDEEMKAPKYHLDLRVSKNVVLFNDIHYYLISKYQESMNLNSAVLDYVLASTLVIFFATAIEGIITQTWIEKISRAIAVFFAFLLSAPVMYAVYQASRINGVAQDYISLIARAMFKVQREIDEKSLPRSVSGDKNNKGGNNYESETGNEKNENERVNGENYNRQLDFDEILFNDISTEGLDRSEKLLKSLFYSLNQYKPLRLFGLAVTPQFIAGIATVVITTVASSLQKYVFF